MGRDDRSQEESGKKRYIPPRFAHLTPEQSESDAGRERLA